MANTNVARTSVITFQLAYLSNVHVDLCSDCVERGDHGQGVLGPVSHGAHEGTCQGEWCGDEFVVLADVDDEMATVASRVCADHGYDVDWRRPERGEAEGTYVERRGSLQILGGTIAVPEQLREVTEAAWEAACALPPVEEAS